MAEVLIRKAALFRSKEQGNAASRETLSNPASALLEVSDRMLRLAAVQRGSADNQRAVGYGFRDRLEFLGTREQRLGSNGRTRFPKCQFERIHNSQMKEPKIAHGARRGPNVERVARRNQNNAQSFKFGTCGQGF